MSIDRAKAMQAAQKYLAKGQVDKAITEYERVIQSDPKDARTLLKLGDLYTRKGANKEASATYRKVAEQYAEQGFFLKAVAVCKQILKLDPNLIDVWEKLAEMYELLSLVSDALATYEHVVDSHMKAGNARKALRGLEKIADLDPENVAARIRHAEALSKLNKLEEAAEAFQKGAELLKKQGRLEDYIKVAERWLFHQTDNHELARELAAAYLERRDPKLALTKLQPCFNAEPKNVDTLRLLARAFEQLGQVPKTVSVLKEVARIYGGESKRAELGSVLRKIVSLDPNDADAKRELSQLGAAPGREPSTPVEIGEDDYDALLVEDEDDAPAQGSSAAREAAEDEHKRAQVTRLLGECDVFVRYGLHDKTIAHLQQVLDLSPKHIEARTKLKDAYLKKNSTADAVMQLIMLAEFSAEADGGAARDFLRDALRLDPANQAVAERLGALESAGPTPTADDDDEVIILDHDEPAAEHEAELSFADVAASKPPAEPARLSEISFDSLLDEADDEPELTVEDEPELSFEDGPELTHEDGDEAEIVMDAEEHEDEPAPAALPSAAPQAAAVAPDAVDDVDEELAETLGEIDFYVKQEMFEEAREALEEALFSFPKHPLLLEKRAAIDAAEQGDAAPVAKPVAKPAPAADKAFALAEKLAGQGAAPGGTSGAGPIDVEDVIAQFKKGVAKQIDAGDSATHYDLGIAYMEMGLQAEAIDEFKLCLNDPTRKCSSHTMIGMAYVAKGDMEPSIEHFKLALDQKPSADEELGLWFEIGNAHELLGKNMEALVWYEKVEEKNPTFRDVAQRIERLGVSRTSEQEADDFDDLFDNMILKE